MKVFSEAEDHRINQLRTVNAIIAGNVLGIITVFFGNNYSSLTVGGNRCLPVKEPALVGFYDFAGRGFL
ncbi:MAG: hypothetical protein PHS68_06770 [Candidatus Izemoplasmatales bacterium]|nr:hypothetical protein [Candidatus Izemoplasmatales bacterium]